MTDQKSEAMTTTNSPTALELLRGRPSIGKRVALVQTGPEGDREVSYDQLFELADRYETMIDELAGSGSAPVVLCSNNTPELIACLFALWRRKILAIPVDFRMTAAELGNIAERVSARALIVSGSYSHLDELKKIAADKIQTAILEDIPEQSSSDERTGEETEDFPALVILTSGTTGKPKGAVHSFQSLVDNLNELAGLVGMDEKRILLLPLPASHIFGLEVLLITLLYGGKVVFSEMEPGRFIASINKYKPNIIAGVPTIYGALKSAGSSKVDVSNCDVLLSGGAPLPTSLAEEFEKEFGRRINNGYGSTESKIICLNVDGPTESIGRPIPSVKVRVLDQDGNELEEGNEGEILIDSALLMTGYLGNQEKSREVLTDRGYRTGDIGYVKDGYVYISGRAKEMIIVAGNKVFPPEVEAVLSRNQLVKEVAVTGQEHRRLGQIVKATIVVADQKLSRELENHGESAKAAREKVLADLKGFSKENLKRELRPMVWDLRPATQPLPKTRSGKIDKKALSS